MIADQYRAYLAIPLLVLLAIVQSTYLAYLRLLGVHIQILVVAVLLWAMWQGGAGALLIAFIAGLLIDVTSSAPLGRASLALMAAALAVALIGRLMPPNRLLVPMVQTAGAMVIFWTANVLLLRISGYTVGVDTTVSIPASIFLHTVVVVPAYWLLQVATFRSRRQTAVNL